MAASASKGPAQPEGGAAEVASIGPADADAPEAEQERIARRSAEASELCERLLGQRVERIEWPGGALRDSLRALLADRSIVVTRRSSERRAELEAFVLRELGARGAPVPELLGHEGRWLIQEDLGPLRLAAAVNAGEPVFAEAALDEAIEALAEAQACGREARLENRLVLLGTAPDWLGRLADTPRRLGQHLGLPAPLLETGALAESLRPRAPMFVKWDARPANASVDERGGVAWFDWEHCGCRDPIDDLVWLLGDEFLPVWPAMEARLVERHLPLFVGLRGRVEAADYLHTFGVLHICQRLALILARKGQGGWWPWSRCLQWDEVGVTAEAAQRLCRRAGAWSERSARVAPLAPWFRELTDRLGELA